MKAMKAKKVAPFTPDQTVRKEAAVATNKKMVVLEVPEEDTDYWYGLAHEKGGVSGVYPSWGEAAPLVVGMSGALVKKFLYY
jgi:hypothetical protein